MSANNHTNPTVTTNYTTFVSELHARIDDAVLQMRSDQVTATNVPVNAIRWNNTNGGWDRNTATAVGTPTWTPLVVTATNVVTNANLTGAIVSVGNATTAVSIPSLSGVITSGGTNNLITSVASQTGTGSTFAMSANPTFTGAPITTTAAVDTNTTQIASTAYVFGQGYLKAATASSTYAPLASPNFSGTPQISGVNIATQSYVTGLAYLTIATAASTYAPLASPTLTGTPLVPNPISGTVEIGYRIIPQRSVSSAYGFVINDAACHILHPSADTTARTFTVPANTAVAYPIGSALTVVNQNGAGVVTIAITTDTMRLAGTGATGNRTLAANGIATILKLTSTEWIISGTGLT